MSRLLIPDSGPLFSLAAANLLPLLAKFSVGITDVVRTEKIDRGLSAGASIEAQRLLLSTQAFLEYAQEKQWIASAAAVVTQIYICKAPVRARRVAGWR